MAWLIPIGLLVGIGHAAAPHVLQAINPIIAEVNGKIRELTPDFPTPDFGLGDITAPDFGQQELAAEFQRQINAINAQLRQITPEVPQEIIAGLLVAAGVAATSVAINVCEEQGYLGHDFAAEDEPTAPAAA